jgi:hypothetical protein
VQYETDGIPGHFIYLEKERRFLTYRFNNKNYNLLSLEAACDGLGFRQINYSFENQWTDSGLELQMAICPGGTDGFCNSTPYEVTPAGYLTGVIQGKGADILKIFYRDPFGNFTPCLTKQLFPLLNGVGYRVKVKAQGSSREPVVDCRLEGF